jgi:hypothetical protein
VTARGARLRTLAALALLGPLICALLGFALVTPRLFALAREPALRAFGYGAAGALAVASLLALRAVLLSRRLTRGAPGRARGMLLGWAFALAFAGLAAASVVILRIAPLLPAGALISLEEAVLLSSSGARAALVTALGVAVAGALVGTGAAVSVWFLIPTPLRSRLFWPVDALLLVACAWLSVAFSFPPRGSEDLAGSTARLVLSLLLGVRLLARLLPHVLDLVERFDMRSLVAARHLRS